MMYMIEGAKKTMRRRKRSGSALHSPKEQKWRTYLVIITSVSQSCDLLSNNDEKRSHNYEIKGVTPYSVIHQIL